MKNVRKAIFLLTCSAFLTTACAGGSSTAPATTGGLTTDSGSSSGADSGAANTADTGASNGSDDAGAAASADTGSAAAVDAGASAPDIQTAADTGGDDGAWGPKHCATKGPPLGFNIGNRLGDIKVLDCDTGKPRSLKEVCGAQKTWLFVAHSHCPTCQQTAAYTAQVAKDVASDGVAVVHIVYIDDHQNCSDWRKKYGLAGIPNLKVYLDTSNASWAKIKTSPYTAPHAIMGKNQVITYKGHGLSPAVVKKKLSLAF